MNHRMFTWSSPLLLVALPACIQGASDPLPFAPPGVQQASVDSAGLSPAGAKATYGCEPGGAIAGNTYLFVDAAAPPGGNGTRAAPYGTVHEGYLAVKSGQKAVICVAQGTYVERVGNAVDRFATKTEYTIVGGFRAGSGFAVRDSVAYPTTIQAPDKTADTAAIVFGNVLSITLDGLGITGGYRGVYIMKAYSPGRRLTLRNNHVYGNGVLDDIKHSGGGLRLNGGQIVIENNVIEDNSAGAGGAGIYIGTPATAECNAKSGGVLNVTTALATIRHNVVRDNVARSDTPHGAGISVGMNAHIHHNRVEGNRGYGPLSGAGDNGVGGGIFLQGRYVTGTIESNWIEDNTAEKAGAGIFIDEAAIGTVVNNVVVGNWGRGAICVDGRGSGNDAEDRGYATLVNNTVWGNSNGALYVIDSKVAAYNNVFWSNGTDCDVRLGVGGSLSQDLTLDHNLMASGYREAVAGTGAGSCQQAGDNLVGVDPQLVDPAAGDYTLGAGSPALDAGAASFAPAFEYSGAMTAAPSVDHDGTARPQGAGVDLGAFEQAL